MNIFEFRDTLINSYKAFSRSFTKIESEDIRSKVEEECNDLKRYWPEPLLQINPSYRQTKSVSEYCQIGKLHPQCDAIFRDKKGQSIRLFSHQDQAIDFAAAHKSYVVTTGTGSGKSLSFFIPIIDRILRDKAAEPNSKPRTRAIILYPMNALANSQLEEIAKFLNNSNHSTELSVARYTGQESAQERTELYLNPPDILLTNYMMLELVLMRHNDRTLVENCKNLEFLVLDELHTYRGRQGSDVAMLVRRLRSQLEARDLICIGTSATMSSVGSREAQNAVVAKFATKIFGTTITPNQVIAETLVRVTNPQIDLSTQTGALHDAVVAAGTGFTPFADYEQFRNNALSVWLELNLSITPERTRAVPLSVKSVVNKLSADANVSAQEAETALKNFLSQFGTSNSVKMPNGRSPFAFKLHQFISGPGKVYLTLDAPGKRLITLDGQTYVTDKTHNGEKLPLFEAYFCRECGQEYIPVWFVKNDQGIAQVVPRNIDEVGVGENESYGYVCPVTASQSFRGNDEELPDDWLDPKNPSKVRSSRKKDVPQRLRFSIQGYSTPEGEEFWVLPGKFKICVNCLHTYTARGRDKHRLIGLSGEGRSSATSVLTLQILQQLYEMPRNPDEPYDFRKLLGFSDNRQDTALQAGHFNDFMNQIVLRGGVVCALQSSDTPVKLNDLVKRICHIFHFDDPHDPQAMRELLKSPATTTGQLLQNAFTALHFSLSYQLLKDLQDRNLYTCPSLEKLGLMRISYGGLQELCSDDEAFNESPVLKALAPEKRQVLLSAFLDEVRRRQCLSSRYFIATEQNAIRDLGHGLLNQRWSFSSVSSSDRTKGDGSAFVLDNDNVKAWTLGIPVRFTERSNLITILSKLFLWQDIKAALPSSVTTDRKAMQKLVCDMTRCLCLKGILRESKTKFGTYYQLDQDAILWSFPQSAPASGVNSFFRDLYLDVADTISHGGKTLFEFEAQEHTAQVSSQEREELEMRFRAGKDDINKWPGVCPNKPFKRLPVLYCSPTMELGIDISALNYVYMRNIPPTAANYVQRAGRAGRSGQQALSLSYCTAMSPHDQWFFRHPEEMVQGVVKEPTLDLSNESLIKSHLHSVWMTAACVELPSTVYQILDLTKPDLPVQAELMQELSSGSVTQAALKLGKEMLSQVQEDLKDQPWFSATYIERVMQQAAADFSKSFDNWRSLYKATLKQIQLAYETNVRPGASSDEKSIANRRYMDASRQKALLEKQNVSSTNNDFYSYRYLASQGFLPGYNFPAMPLLAWVPDVSNGEDKSTMLSRARFLGLAEFGPRNVIYHRGHIYRIDRLKINVQDGTATASNNLPTISVAACPHCGYAHILNSDTIFNECENCGAALSPDNVIAGLYKVSMVETSEIERISIEDENRRSQGFEMQTLYRFSKAPNGTVLKETSDVLDGVKPVATLTYAPAASVWRVNLGWKHRVNQKTKGFVINPLSGYWHNEGPDADEKPEAEDKLQLQTAAQTIVPFVTDTRNILLFEPKIESVDLEELETTMATLQAALKRSIEQTYQIESSEIFVEPVPGTHERRMLLIYEAGEGGSGVLRDIIKNPDAIGRIARQALELMHYDIGNVQNLDADELEQYDTKADCINGCYGCLLTYYNQPEHLLINRRDPYALKYLVALTHAHAPTPVAKPPESSNSNDTLSPIARFCDWTANNGYLSPDQMPKVFKRLNLTFDGAYSALRYCISFSPVDQEDIEALEDFGWQILDLSDEKRWFETMLRHPELSSAN